jgi:exosortase A-associated hydrolase 1
MSFVEDFVGFECEGVPLAGIVARPERPLAIGVVVVVGGPQYRVGSHRQFVLLSRALAEAGFASMRFDYRGMGDSGGAVRSFDTVSADIATALDCFARTVPDVRRVVLWGLCDGASAAAIYAATDPRVVGLALFNPWVRSESGESRALIRTYYLSRLLSRAFWSKLVCGEYDVLGSVRSFVGHARRSLVPGSAAAVGSEVDVPTADFRQRMYAGLARFRGAVLVVTSGRDLVAAEFLQQVRRVRAWSRLLERPGVSWENLAESDHTFSSRVWRDRVAEITIRWLRALERSPTKG